MPRARKRLPGGLQELTRSEWERLIREANYGEENTQIAELYFIDQLTQGEIAVEMDMRRPTITVRLEKMIERAQKVAQQLDMIKKQGA